MRSPNEISRLSDWNLDFRQIEPGPMKSAVRYRSGRSIGLLEIAMSRAVHQTGHSPDGFITVGLVNPGQLDSWQGRGLSRTKLVCFGGGTAFDGVSVGQFRGTTISIRRASIEAAADNLGLDMPASVWSAGVPGHINRSPALGTLQGYVSELLGSPRAELSSEVEEAIVLKLLLAATDEGRRADASVPRRRARALSGALDLMLAREMDIVAIGEICREVGASWRTLDRAFKEKFGIGPKRYYRRLRLNRVRSLLVSGDREFRVSDAANAYGFWHLGEFAKDYFKMFGELPSETKACKH